MLDNKTESLVFTTHSSKEGALLYYRRAQKGLDCYVDTARPFLKIAQARRRTWDLLVFHLNYSHQQRLRPLATAPPAQAETSIKIQSIDFELIKAVSVHLYAILYKLQIAAMF